MKMWHRLTCWLGAHRRPVVRALDGCGVWACSLCGQLVSSGERRRA